MKRSGLMTFAIAGALTLASCGENQNQNNAAPMQNDKRMPTEGSHEGHAAEQQGNLDDGARAERPEFNDEDLASVYEHYLHVKTALVNSNASEASNGAEMLAGSLEQAEAGEDAVRAARQISQNEDLSAQRTAFSDLSASVEGLLEGNLASGQIYKQYCPMAFEGSGAYWLSASEEVRNPYFGDKMLKCGRVEETIQ